MSLECGECEHDLRGEHDENCSRHSSNVIARLKQERDDYKEKCIKNKKDADAYFAALGAAEREVQELKAALRSRGVEV